MAAPASRPALEQWLARAESRPGPWLLGFALVLALQISPLWYASPDGAAYLSIARSLAAGGPAARFGDPQVGYPLGYPWLISPAFRTGAQPFLLLSVVHWLMAVAFMLGVYRWMRRTVGAGALWLTGLVMANVSVWTIYRRTLSETAFLAAMIWTVCALDGALDHLDGRPRQMARLLAGAGLLIGLTMIREAGVLFGAGFVLALLARTPRTAGRRGLALGLLVGAAALLVALASIRPERLAAAGPALAGHLDGYADVGTALRDSIGQRVYVRVSEVGQLLMPGMFHAYGRGWWDVNTLVYAPLFMVVGVGWWRLMRRRRDVYACTAPLYVAAHVWWPYVAGTRYLLPLLPLLALCVWTWLAPHRRWRLGFVVAALLANLGVAVGHWLIRDRPEAGMCARQWPEVEKLAAHIGVDSGPVMTADVPACVTLMLAVTLDRPVQRGDGRGALQARPHWIVAPEGAAPIPDYLPADGAGHYALLRRQP